jgi:hypothetical protein
MKNQELIEELKDQGTWRLLGLGLITYGVYFAHYIKRQTSKINSRLDKDRAISDGLIRAVFATTYLSAALFLAYLFVDDDHPIAKASDVVDWLNALAMIVWGVKARNRMNSICEIDSNSKAWFNGPASLIFSPLYFNYKINQLSAANAKANQAPAGQN